MSLVSVAVVGVLVAVACDAVGATDVLVLVCEMSGPLIEVTTDMECWPPSRGSKLGIRFGVGIRRQIESGALARKRSRNTMALRNQNKYGRISAFSVVRNRRVEDR